MKTSIYAYLLMLFCGLLVLVNGVSIVLNNIFLEQYYISSNEEVFDEAGTHARRAMHGPDSNRRLFDLDRAYQVTIEVVDENIRTVATSYGAFGDTEISMDDKKGLIGTLIADYPEEIENGYLYITTNEIPNFSEYSLIIYMSKMSSGDYLVLTRPLHFVADNISMMNQFYMISGIVALIMGGLFTMYFSKKFTKPIIQINEVAKKMSNLDFSEKIESQSKNELGTLAGSINFLSSELEKNIQALQGEVEFQKILSRNVSHELKTPVAVIKGYAEGIHYGVADTKEKEEEYLSLIINECDRMDGLIKDMLTYSKLSSNVQEYEREAVATRDIGEKITATFAPMMEQKSIQFTTDIVEIEIYGNEDSLVQSMYNYISNAMKYGDGKRIHFSIKENEGIVSMEVFNTGVQLAEEEHKKIFDIFYTIDAARTRDVNGHGLGLSIVKSIAKKHEGCAYCRNDTDSGQEKGMTFVIEIPK
ncbi:MAG: HAMP domain-containing sensor histidine kinase [Bacillota bacterium]